MNNETAKLISCLDLQRFLEETVNAVKNR